MGVTSHLARTEALYKAYARQNKGVGPQELKEFEYIMQGYYDQFKEDKEFPLRIGREEIHIHICTKISMLLTSISRSHPFGEK